MSGLRIIGFVVGIIGLLATFLVYRGPKWKRSNFIVFSFFNLLLIVISLNPEVVNLVRDALALQQAQRGRILALLILSNVFLAFYLFFTRSKLESFHHQFDQLIRSLGGNAAETGAELLSSIKPIMVLIPAYNEAKNLMELLPKIPKEIRGAEVGVLVVDDASEDDTSSVASEKDGVIVVKNPINRGGGAALRLGYDILSAAGAHICVTMDADGQHRPEEIEMLVGPVMDDQYDFVIGSRILGEREKGSRFRIIGVFIFSKIISLLSGKQITDPSSGFRAFKMDGMQSIDLYEDQYHTSELILEVIKKGMRIGEVPITILRRRHGKSKKGKDWKYGLNFARVILRTWWR